MQACRQYENHDDICTLCLKLLGSSEDKKFSATIADWVKTKRYENKVDIKVQDKSVNPASVQNLPGQPSLPYPCPQYPYPFPMNFNPGFPFNGTFAPPFMGMGMNRPGNGPRPMRKRGTNCFYCKASGHFINECPKMKKKIR